MTETRWFSRDETAQLVRHALAARFPGSWFSVRSRTMLGASGLVVRWRDGPTLAEVEAVARLYAGSTFDPCSGTVQRHDSLLCQPDGLLPQVVRFGAEVVLCSRRLSGVARAALDAECERWLGEPFDHGLRAHRRLHHVARALISFDDAGTPHAAPGIRPGWSPRGAATDRARPAAPALGPGVRPSRASSG